MPIDIQNLYRNNFFNRRQLRKLTRDTLAFLIHWFDLPQHVTIGILYVDNPQMCEYNKKHMGKNIPTDVISFPFWDMNAAQSPEPYAGDMIISVEQASQQAGQEKHSLEDELKLLLVHGFLHLMGYEDETPSKKRHMLGETREILKGLGLKKII